MEEDEKERNWKDWIKTIPRIIVAILWASITLIVFLIPSMFLEGLLPSVSQEFILIAGVFATFEFSIHLLTKTIFSPTLTIAREVVTILVLIIFTNGGKISIVLPLEGVAISIVADFTPVFAFLLIFSLLSIAKNALQVYDLLSEADEEPVKIT